MTDNVGELYILNDILEPVHKLKDADIQKDKMVYEVIRIIEGVPLFFEAHYSRMRNSLSLVNKELTLSEQELKEQIRKLVNANKFQNCNIKIIVYTQSEKQNLLIYISKSYYPNKEEIEKGVPVSLMHLERENPNAKLVNQKYKDEVERKIKEEAVFETLLVDNDEKITEGSRSNVFFIKGSKAYTAPGKYVLMGITRQYIIEACKNAGVEVVETLINLDDLYDMEGLFISGTSIKVLPISSVNGHAFNSSVHPTVIAIRDQFDKILQEYILENSSEK